MSHVFFLSSPQGPAGLKGGEGPQGPPGPVVSTPLLFLFYSVLSISVASLCVGVIETGNVYFSLKFQASALKLMRVCFVYFLKP